MRIFSKKTFQFNHPVDHQIHVTVQALAFEDVPDWVPDSMMYKLAEQDDDIMVINTPQDEIAAEIGSPDISKRQKAAEAKAQKQLDAANASATTAVTEAETTPTQESVDAAAALVAALPSGLSKAALEVRVSAAQDIVTAAAQQQP